eukprot:SAG31_NODE_818_length_11820_cov_22.864431_4_plen_186_part_00
MSGSDDESDGTSSSDEAAERKEVAAVRNVSDSASDSESESESSDALDMVSDDGGDRSGENMKQLFSTQLMSLSAPFCEFCGAMLEVADLGQYDTTVNCVDCHRPAKIDMTAVVEVTRALDGAKLIADDGNSADKRDEDQPTIDEECPSCNNNLAYYRTMQLRSADEGQTIFYTCTECGWKWRQNS